MPHFPSTTFVDTLLDGMAFAVVIFTSPLWLPLYLLGKLAQKLKLVSVKP